ncbi:hypothetical protein [Frigoriglobus tundricola]|uniref:Uncharacterized protein n=1 Tax=Frigoriglobus tundricola TaxID=2774151 RepID=A0A6M5YSG4_9BACT|nr:hypothetical protein [Frigoriglobus tundricola]QJW96995.1 hypothetical protein FTUN_4555 [Frigoriglobus tundricola]
MPGNNQRAAVRCSVGFGVWGLSYVRLPDNIPQLEATETAGNNASALQLDYKQRLLTHFDSRHNTGCADADHTAQLGGDDPDSNPVPNPQRHPTPEALTGHLGADRHTKTVPLVPLIDWQTDTHT